MSDPTFQADHYLLAEHIVDSLLQNLAIEFQVTGEQLTRDQMQAHVNKRAALILTKRLLLDEAERVGYR